MTEPLQLTQAEARDLFDYRDGLLWWRQTGPGRRAGRPAGGFMGDPYRVISIGPARERRHYYAHFLIWNWHYGPTSRHVTWRDGDPLNCSVENLMEIAAPRWGGEHPRAISGRFLANHAA